jgi:hypothetical protein
LILQALVGDGTRCADILVRDGDIRVVVTVDGPFLFLRSLDGEWVRYRPAAQVRDITLQRWGYSVINVPIVDESVEELQSTRFREMLKGLLEGAGVRVKSGGGAKRRARGSAKL